MKEKGSSPYNIVHGVNHVTTGISSMHVDQEVDESNGETEYNFKSENEDDDDSEPMSGACFHQVSHHMKNDTRRMKP